MIKLTVNSGSQPTTRIFHKNMVIVGSNPSNADLVLSNEMLQESHVKITYANGGFLIINLANDPFVTLNGLPFGKKILKNNDIIQIGSIKIHVEELRHSSDNDNLSDTVNKLPDILEKTLQPTTDLSEIKLNPYTDPFAERTIYPDDADDFNSPFNDDLESFTKQSLMEQADAFFEEDLVNYDMEALMHRVEQLEQEGKTNDRLKKSSEEVRSTFQQPAIEKNTSHKDIHSLADKLSVLRIEEPPKETLKKDAAPPTSSSTKLSLKDYYLKDSEDESEQWEESKEAKKEADPLSPRKWKLLFKIFLAFLMLSTFAIGLLYLWVSDQSEEEEIKAAKGVADVAMALTYAQVNHTKPQNQNWSDPEFVKNNLTAVLASIYPSFACFDPQGQFLNCPYILRIYTSSDLSKFLVIAQAAPSVFQWIIPKASIVVESNAMEMRKITDLRAMNRLLVNANNLDGVNAVEISQLVKQGKLIPLSHLTNKNENEGFNPPKALAFIHPGAENLIYNAPRYYQLGQSLLERSLSLNDHSSNENEVALFQQEIAALSHFNDMVLYSSKGMQVAMHAQKALMTIVPSEKFIIAYLQFNSEGKVLNSHLLIDNAASEMANALMKNQEQQGHDLDAEETGSVSPLEADKSHPIYLQAIALKHLRQEALTPISAQMTTLLNNHNREIQPSFSDHFRSLIVQYQQTSEEMDQKIIEKLSDIHREYTDLPLQQFMVYVKDAGLDGLVHEVLQSVKYNDSKDKLLTTTELDLQLKKIEESKDWQEFDQQVNEMAEMLKLERIADPGQLTAFQNAARLRVNQKLTEFLLSPRNPIPEGAFSAENRTILTHILKTSWIFDQDTYDFYVNEFDLQVQTPSLTADK